MQGSLEVITGCMYAGKTEELLRRVRRLAIGKQSVQVFSHASDTRYGVGAAVTHDQVRLPAVPVSSTAELLARVATEATAIAIDEAQFFDAEMAEVCERLASEKRVIVAGLDLDFRGDPFGPIPALLAFADSVSKLTAVCMTCGNAATRSQRLTAGTNVIEVGSRSRYEARCRLHFSPVR